MNSNEKGDIAAANPEVKTVSTKQRCKDRTFSVKFQIFELLKAGGEYTAVELNRITNKNDSRKNVSLLRKLHYPIKDRRLCAGSLTKVYFMNSDWEREMRDDLSRLKELLNQISTSSW